MDIEEYSQKLHTQNILSYVVRTIVFICVCVSLILGIAFFLNTPPPNFPVNTEFVITEGSTVSDITDLCAEQNLVRSGLYLYVLLLYGHEDIVVQAGTYSFDTQKTTREVASALVEGTLRKPEVSITLPEGFQARDITEYLEDHFPNFTADTFIPFEGYLFPDTYFVSPSATPDDIRILLTSTTEKRLGEYSEAIKASGFSEQEVIILASIIEREAKSLESKRIVSGILQNRLRNDMPLQVDATFNYILEKTSAELTMDDLYTDSPYNTYRNTGLPPTPISNPGIESIEAVLYPEASDYFYYLTDSDGTFHYAKTFDEHKVNKARYLR